MMRAGLSCGFFIESRDVRRFDSHNSRKNLWKKNGDTPVGNKDQTDMMSQDLWDPLHVLVHPKGKGRNERPPMEFVLKGS